MQYETVKTLSMTESLHIIAAKVFGKAESESPSRNPNAPIAESRDDMVAFLRMANGGS